MSEKYKIIVEREGVNHVKVFKSEGNGYVNDWNFPLKGDDEPIVFSEFYTDTKFIVVNWDAWVRVYDADTKEVLFDKKLNGKIDSKAVFSLDKTKLYVALNDESYQAFLMIISLDSFAIETKKLPPIYNNHLAIRKDGNLLFYNNKSSYSVLDMTSFKRETFQLPFAPQDDFNEFVPVVDIKNNRVIMPTYDDVPTKTTATGETVFEFRIVMFDLNTFETIALLSVRDFAKNELGYNPNDGDRISEIFLETERDDDYMEALREFYENLNTIKVVSDGICLCWRGGILRKINADFSMSPLLVTASKDNAAVGMFNFPYFHSHLYQIDDTMIVLAEHLDFCKSPMPSIENADSETPIPLAFVKTTREELFRMTYSEKQKEEIENRDSIQIETTNLSTKNGIEEGLLQIKDIVSDLKAAGIGSTLLFVFKDKSGKTMQEPEFFQQAVLHSPSAVQTLIETAIACSDFKYIYRNSEESALCYAVYELAKQDESYLTTVLKYLAAIDIDHDVFNKENLIPLLEEKYTHKVLAKKMKPISEKLTEWYLDYCEEMHEE